MLFHKIVLPLALSLLATPALAATIGLSGQVTYRERMALPELATLGIQLIDETMPGAPPRVSVEAPIGPGQVPLSFDLRFEDSLILPAHSYALIATISAEGGLLFRNAEPYRVNPLAPEAPILIFTNRVRQVEDTAMSSEPVAPPPPAILETTWTATSIGGQPPAPRSNTSLTIGADMRAGGTGGCNSYFAQATLDADRLSFGLVTATQKSCLQSINLQERAFFDALAKTARWQVSGDELTLFGADGKALLVFTR